MNRTGSHEKAMRRTGTCFMVLLLVALVGLVSQLSLRRRLDTPDSSFTMTRISSSPRSLKNTLAALRADIAMRREHVAALRQSGSRVKQRLAAHVSAPDPELRQAAALYASAFTADMLLTPATTTTTTTTTTSTTATTTTTTNNNNNNNSPVSPTNRDSPPRKAVGRVVASTFCKGRHGDMCAWMIKKKGILERWRAYQDIRQPDRLAQLRQVAGGARSPSAPHCDVRLFWGDCKDCKSVFGHVWPKLMASATRHCPTPCRQASGRSDAHVSFIMFMYDVRGPTRPYRPSPSPGRPSQAIARLNMEGRGMDWMKDEMDVPAVPAAAASATSDAMDARVATDLLVSPNTESDVRINYFYGFADQIGCGEVATHQCLERWVSSLPPVKALGDFGVKNAKGELVLGSFFVSACSDQRLQLLRDLAAQMPLHSYGKCDHTPGLDEADMLRRHEVGRSHGGAGGKTSQNNKAALSSLYPFYISFENTIEDGYRTEKVALSLASGVVPVILADPNVLEDLPPGSFINVHDFADMNDLAAHLRDIAADANRYASYFEWRRRPEETLALLQHLSDENFLATGANSWLCRVCQAYERQFDPDGRRCGAR